MHFKSLFDDLLTFLGIEVVVVSFLFSYGLEFASRERQSRNLASTETSHNLRFTGSCIIITYMEICSLSVSFRSSL